MIKDLLIILLAMLCISMLLSAIRGDNGDYYSVRVRDRYLVRQRISFRADRLEYTADTRAEADSVTYYLNTGLLPDSLLSEEQ